MQCHKCGSVDLTVKLTNDGAVTICEACGAGAMIPQLPYHETRHTPLWVRG